MTEVTPGSNPGGVTKFKIMNKIKERRIQNAICPKCKSPDYKYVGRADNNPEGKHQFECNSCKNNWQYGKTYSHYLKLK